MAAGRAWATGLLGAGEAADSEALADARRWGAEGDALEALRAALDGGRAAAWDGVWPDNAPGLDAFLAAQTQWRVGGGMRPIFVGLDYAGARAAHAALAMEVTPAVWDAMQAVEAGALDALTGGGEP